MKQKTKRTPRGQARERILETACDLFYTQGYHTTGVQQIIDEAGVSKATFYAHFPSKDDLCLAYLRERDRFAQGAVKDAVEAAAGPLARFMAPIEFLLPWLRETGFRGCLFSNLAAEVVDPTTPLRKEVRFHADGFRAVVRDVAESLIASDTDRYGHLDAEQLTNDYYLITWGGISGAQHYHAIWPMKHAVSLVRRLVEAP